MKQSTFITKQTALITGVVVLIIGAILLLAHTFIAGGILAALGILAILGSFLVPGATRSRSAMTQPHTPATDLDALVPGQDPSLNQPVIIPPNDMNEIYASPSPAEESGADIAPGLSSGPPHPPEYH